MMDLFQQMFQEEHYHYAYLWSNGDFTSNLNNLSKGFYTLEPLEMQTHVFIQQKQLKLVLKDMMVV